MLVLGHRGASGAFPENTPAAFAAADAMGADGVELDVRLSPDGPGRTRLVVHHDPLPDDRRAVAALSSFDEVLDACGDRMLINVEIKNRDDDGGFDPTMAMVAPVIDALRRRGDALVERVLISSFSIETVDHCRLVAPEIPTAVLSTLLELDDGRPLVVAAADGGHAAVHPNHHVVTDRFVEAAHRAELAVNVWTVNEVDAVVRLAEMGVDGVCTDVPDESLAALGRSPSDRAVRPSWATPRRPA